MFDFLYQILIFPFEYVLGYILEALYSSTNNYGWAIVLLSLFVNVLLLPFYKLAERWQAIERSKQANMSDKAAEIKSVYKGNERHSLLSTLYRQHGYKPIHGLKSLAGLFVQAPFFIAAYYLLLDYPALQGHGFLFLSDLALPDQIILTPLATLNAMPFIMVFVNLVSVYFYGADKSFKENAQQYTIALIFLIALYSASSALLLYWTISNIFSLGKNALHRKKGSAVGIELSEEKRKQSDIVKSGKKLFLLGWTLMFFLPLISAPIALLESGSIIDFSESNPFSEGNF